MQICLTPISHGPHKGQHNIVGMDSVSFVAVLEDGGDTLTVKVPGHKEATGYDRLAGGNTYSYIRTQTIVMRVVDRYADRWDNEWVEVK